METRLRVSQPTCPFDTTNNQSSRREGRRDKKRLRNTNNSPVPVPLSTPDLSREQTFTSPGTSSQQDVSFIADHSVLSYYPSSRTPASICNTAAIVPKAEATTLLKEPLLQALIDSYFAELFHLYPIVDRHDIIGAPEILYQSICLAGSQIRQCDEEALGLSRSLYEKAKTLIYLSQEEISITTLKSLVLMTLWSPRPPNILTLDGPWHWSGVAMRLALQMGLHKEATYVEKPDSGCRRRVWWVLYVSSAIHVQ